MDVQEGGLAWGMTFQDSYPNEKEGMNYLL